MVEEGVREPEVALGVLEIDGIDLVGHGGRADLARRRPAPEVAEGDVAPRVAGEVDEHRVEPRDRPEQLREPVVGLDLGGVRIELEPQLLFDETPREVRPVHLRVRRQMSVVVAGRAVHLGEDGLAGDLGALPVEAGDHVRDLLPHGRRRGGLTVGAGEHRGVRVPVGEGPERRRERVDGGEEHLVPRAAEEGRPREVVDVLGGAGEVGEPGDEGPGREPFPKEVLDRLDVVVGGAFDRLHGERVRLREPARHRVQAREGGRVRLRSETGLRGQPGEPRGLDADPRPDERELAEPRAKLRRLARVAPVERREGGERRELHQPTPPAPATVTPRAAG